MDKKWVLTVGIVVIVYGLLLLLGQLFHFDIWAYTCPLLLIGLGIWVILRPRMLGSGTAMHARILGDILRGGAWKVSPEEIWLGIGNVVLDFTDADIPQGETTITVNGFIGDVRAYVPDGVGIRVSCAALISDLKMYEDKETSILMPLDRSSDDFAGCTRKVVIKSIHFISGVKIRKSKKV